MHVALSQIQHLERKHCDTADNPSGTRGPLRGRWAGSRNSVDTTSKGMIDIPGQTERDRMRLTTFLNLKLGIVYFWNFSCNIF